jgi:phosphoglucosamine mutase
MNVKTTHSSQLVIHPKVHALVQEIEHNLQGQGRVLLRPSGTEPVLRVRVEGMELENVRLYAQTIADCLTSLDKEA